VVSDDFRKGLTEAVEKGDYHLLLTGATNQWSMRRMLFGSVPQPLMDQQQLAIGVMRRLIPVTARLKDTARRMMERVVPQLERADRLTLVERVQGSSQ